MSAVYIIWATAIFLAAMGAYIKRAPTSTFIVYGIMLVLAIIPAILL